MPSIIRVFCGLASVVLLGWGLATIDDVSDARWLTTLGIAWLLLLLATYVPLSNMPQLSRSLIRLAIVFATVLAIVSVQLIRIQVVQQDAIAYRTAQTDDGDAIANPRVVLTPLENQRGEILDRDGVVIAATTEQDGNYYRSWPNPATSYIAGYHSPFLFGSSGLELSYADVLTGQAGNNPVTRLFNNLLHQPQQGSDISLTLDTGLQESAQSMLGDQIGAVVVVDVDTGDIIVMASSPNYDPNQLFTTSPTSNADAQAYWDTLVADPDAPLVTRANLGLYTPGSTFKTVTAAIAIELGYANPESVYTDDGQLVIDGRVLEGQNRPNVSQTQWTLREGIMWSLNIVLAQVGLQIGGGEFWDMAQRFGFGRDIPFDLPVSESQLASDQSFLDSSNAVADTGFGQGEIQVSPLHIAMITAGVANDGVIMQPRLVDQIVSPNGSATDVPPSETWLTPMSPETASQVEAMMVHTVNAGSVQAAQAPGYVVGGKTGTAETGVETPHAWFIGFIGPLDGESQYAVAVVLEFGGSGLTGPVSIGRDMLLQTMETPQPSD
ncbi:penicillin-binding transpeptidase domain-containing protein [soil metagenome]